MKCLSRNADGIRCDLAAPHGGHHVGVYPKTHDQHGPTAWIDPYPGELGKKSEAKP